MTNGSTERTAREERVRIRAEFARVLRRALDRHDVTQAQLADLCGVATSKVGRWLDHTANEVPGFSDVSLFPTAVAREVMTWLGSHQHVTISDALTLADVSDHYEHLHCVIESGSQVHSIYAGALRDQSITIQEQRELAAALEKSIEAQQALLNDCRAALAAHAQGVVPRKSEPRMAAVK